MPLNYCEDCGDTLPPATCKANRQARTFHFDACQPRQARRARLAEEEVREAHYQDAVRLINAGFTEDQTALLLEMFQRGDD